MRLVSCVFDRLPVLFYKYVQLHIPEEALACLKVNFPLHFPREIPHILFVRCACVLVKKFAELCEKRNVSLHFRNWSGQL